MRASMSSASGCENVSNVRTMDAGGGGVGNTVEKLVMWKLPGASPKNSRSTATCDPSRQLCPETPLGIGRADERRPRGRVRVRQGVPVVQRPRDRVPRPPEVEVVLVVQQLIAASAPAMFSSARSLALSAALRSLRAMSCRATSFQLRPGALCHQRAMKVWSSVRAALSTRPRRLDLVELSGVLRAVERGRRNAPELRRALDEERRHAADPRSRIEDRQPRRRVDQG